MPAIYRCGSTAKGIWYVWKHLRKQLNSGFGLLIAPLIPSLWSWAISKLYYQCFFVADLSYTDSLATHRSQTNSSNCIDYWSREWSGFSNGQINSFHLDKMAAILADDKFSCNFVNENDRIPIQISLKFVPRNPIDSKPALVQVMAWCWSGDKPLPEPMLIQFTDGALEGGVKTIQKYNNITSYFLVLFVSTHWGRATHICVSKLTIIGSDNGVSPGRRQTII